MKRAKWKGPFIKNTLFRNLAKQNHKIWSRNSTIPLFFKDKKVLIYSGKTFVPTKITRSKVGFKFGQFCYSRRLIFKKQLKKFQQKIKKKK